MRARYAILALCSGFILACVSDPTEDLYDFWLPEVVGGDDGCEVADQIEVAFWHAEVERGGSRPFYHFRPMFPAREDLDDLYCPQVGGALDCWSTGIEGGEAGRVGWFTADLRGDTLTGVYDIEGRYGDTCTSTLEVEVRRLDWKRTSLPDPDPSCAELEGQTNVLGQEGEVQLWVMNTVNTTIRIVYYPVGDVETDIVTVGPYTLQMLDSRAGHMMRALRADDGSCLSAYLVDVQDGGMQRWVVGG